MRNSSRFIPGEQIDAVSQWSFGAVDTLSLLAAAKAREDQEAASQAHDEAVRQRGFAEGFAQGHAHALVLAEQKIGDYMAHQGRDGAQHLAALIASAREQLGQSQQVMAQGVLELACELARQVLRHELSVNPNALQPVIREALGLLEADSKSAVVRLNPLDVQVLREALQAEFEALGLTLIPDPAVKPGDCLIASSGTVVDGSLASRWRRAVANLGLSIAWEEG